MELKRGLQLLQEHFEDQIVKGEETAVFKLQIMEAQVENAVQEMQNNKNWIKKMEKKLEKNLGIFASLNVE